MTRCIALILCLILFTIPAHADKQKTTKKIHAQIQCYHYDPRHPYLDPDGASLFPKVSTFMQSGHLSGSFFIASGAPQSHKACELNCNVAIPKGHSLLKMTASVGGREYPISFGEKGREGSFKRIVVFGDSLSEEGRVVKALQKFRRKHVGPMLKAAMRVIGCRLPSHFFDYGLKPYWNGGFSNGPMWPSHLSAMLDNMAVDNRSFGGATTGSRHCHHIHFGSLLKRYLKANKDADAFGDNLFLIWLGANNYFHPRGLPSTAERDQKRKTEVSKALSEIEQGVKSLCERGARHVVLFTIPNLQQSPRWIFDEPSSEDSNRIENQKSEWKKAVAEHNQELRSRFGSVASQTGCQVSLFDADAILEKRQSELGIDPLKTWLDEHVRTPYEKLIHVEGYFDPVHPTTMVHCFLAGEIHRHLQELGLVQSTQTDLSAFCRNRLTAITRPTRLLTSNKHDEL